MSEAMSTANQQLGSKLVSLEDIIHGRTDSSDPLSHIESYIRKPDNTEDDDEDWTRLNSGQTIVVHRIDLNFDNTECKLLTFSDLTIYQKLK